MANYHFLVDAKEIKAYPIRNVQSTGLHPTVQAFRSAFDAGIQYCTPYWEQAARLYEFFRNKRFDALNGTYSKINIAYGYAAVQDRAPKIRQNVFGGPDFVTLRPDTPEAEFSREPAEAWLKELLLDRVKIQQACDPCIQGDLIMGTAYRMPGVTYVPAAKKGEWEPVIFGRNVDFFHVIPGPGGGDINPQDNQSGNAVPWVMVIDWWSEEKIKYLTHEKKYLNPEGVAAMLRDKSTGTGFPEERFRNSYATVGNLQYGGPESWRADMAGVDDKAKRRRIVHWYRRDKHIIVGEDAFLLYEGPCALPGGVIPLVKYITCPDLSNWFGIPYLGTMEDVLKASIMNVNYRMDHLASVMFPETWIRQDVLAASKKDITEFRPRPNAIHAFPSTLNQRISDVIFHDRRPEITPQAFMEESSFKAIIQKVGGQTETTSSMGDVVGNKTATGVTSIMNELMARPNMESMIFENGLRDECQLYLALAADHYTEPRFIRAQGRATDGFPWQTVMPADIAAKFTVITHGTKYMADQQINFQKMIALYPYWNQSPNWDKYELDRQVAEVASVLPDYKRALISPDSQAQAQMPEGGEDPAALGGMTSALDIGQATRSTQSRSTPQPRTGRTVPANAAY